MPDPSAAADRLDYWIRRHAVQLYCGIHPAQKKSKSNPDPQRLVGLSAIGLGTAAVLWLLARYQPPSRSRTPARIPAGHQPKP